jgi:hypothetical protein
LDLTSEELERVLLQKEGESLKDNVVHQSRSGGAGSKRVIGKAVAKGGLLLKGKNPGNVPFMLFLGLSVVYRAFSPRFSVKKMTYGRDYQQRPTSIEKQSPKHKLQDRSTSTSNFLEYYGCVCIYFSLSHQFSILFLDLGLERVC